MIVLTEASSRAVSSPSLSDIQASTAAAELAGCQIFQIEPDFSRCGDAEGALWHIPVQATPQPTSWIGFIPPLDHYRAVYAAALGKQLQLLNSPEEHQRVQEFDSAYPFISGLTPESVSITDADQIPLASQLGFPLFVRGAVQSRKARGWRACVAENREELSKLVRELLNLENRARGRVVCRQLLRLRHSRTSENGFPLGREYRIFLFRQKILGCGYYWEGDDPLRTLSPQERVEVESLAITAAERLQVPHLTVDIGQEENGKWWVIETGDAQFSGFSQVSRLVYWHKFVEQSSATTA